MPTLEASVKVDHRAKAPSQGCGKNASPTEHIGDRSYVLGMPAPYDANEPYPLIFVFHGSFSDGSKIRALLDLERGTSAVFVYPDGIGEGWTLTRDGRDVAFIDELLRDVEGDLCIDQHAIFAVGFSYGGWMAGALACARPALLRGIVSIAGGGPNVPCDARVAAMIVHGSNDFNEPFPSGEASRDHWLAANACSKKTHAVGSCVAYEGCAAPVLFCRHEGEHVVPDFAARETWSFVENARR
jgi:poly(3-hydroxybutyrate) depolymerase